MCALARTAVPPHHQPDVTTMSLCLDLVSFADGELDAERAAAFRGHLRTCAVCRTGLVEAMQLSAQLSTLTPSLDGATPVAAAPIGSTTAKLRIVEPVPVHAMRPRGSRPIESVQRPPPSSVRTSMLKVSAVLLPAAAAVLLLHFGSTDGEGPEPTPTVNIVAQRKARPLPIRLAYRDATGHQPMGEASRGSSGTTAPADRIPYAVLSALEASGDKHGLAIARAWNGEKLDDVLDQLSALAPTPSVLSDRAAIEIMITSNDNVDKVLAQLEALAGSNDVAAARAARWNYAILLSRLELPLTAARAFQAIAAEQEAGWADEARSRAATEAQRAQDFKVKWQRASDAGKALVEAGVPVPSELVQALPGLLRAHFYNAVRTAPSRERVLALAAMAAELDRIGDPHQQVLSEYVQRVAKLDFRHRAPLARAYADLLQDKPLTEQLKTVLTAETASDDIADIVMGAMVERDMVAAHRDWFRKMVARTGDRWFAILLSRVVADVELNAGKWLEAEAVLRNAESLCSSAVLYQCLTIERRLGRLYTDLHRVHESLIVLQNAVRAARNAGEWGRYRALLLELADVERFHSAAATVRAYANELLLTGDDCATRGPTYHVLVGASIIDVDGRAARRYLTSVLECMEPDLSVANHLADLSRLDPQPGDLAQLQRILSKVRASNTLTAAQLVLTYQIEGRLLVERDRTAGIALLQKAIAEADKMPREVVADKARAGAYNVLVFDAAGTGDYTRALSLVAEELGLSPPGACAVVMTAEDERAVVAVRGSDGNDRGEYIRGRRASSGAPTVSPQLAESLARCPRVRVMAPAPLQGQPRVLPAGLAWSYVTSARVRGTPPPDRSTEPHTLIVTNVTPPAYLQLPPLAVQPPAGNPAITLSGFTATPARVLAMMSSASEIQFHTHALMDVGVSDASHLVLSPEGGRYALTAEDIRGTQLQHHPIVVLAACHSAQGARYQHAPWSLPDAFLAAGARAVFAAASEIPDVESGRFLASVLARVRAGVDPAVALRDQRLAADSRASSWVADVILFE
jgi:hypothetical protein